MPRRVLLALALCLAAIGAPRFATASELTAPIERLDAALLQAMKLGKSAPFKQRYDVLAPAVLQAVDVDDILAGAVGPAWASLPANQQAALKAAWQRYAIASYASTFDSFSGERFELYPPAAGGTLVRVKIVPGQPGDDTHVLGYMMRRGSAGWKAIDVTADSTISQVTTQQDQIRSLWRSGGYAGLLTRLQQKVADMSGGTVR